MIIDRDNARDYVIGFYPFITGIKWKAGEFTSTIKNFPNLQILYCANNWINTLKPLQSCINLEELCLHNCEITTIEPLSSCINLQKLFLNNNQLTTIDSLRFCTSLQELFLNDNQLTTIDPLSYCINLQILWCNGNQLTTIEPLRFCQNLRELQCTSNQLTTIIPLQFCVNLRILYCSDNQITTLEPLIYLRLLRKILYQGNPLNTETIQVQRFLNRAQTIIGASVYTDRQNVHDTNIQRSVCDSIQSLLHDDKPTFSIDFILESDLDGRTKAALIEYCADRSVHSVHLITYEELLGYIWQRIVNSPDKAELFRILSEQIADSECKCFTGRFNRTLSVLVGFFDDIIINISDKSRIGAIIVNCRDKVIPYDINNHKKMATEELLEAGYVISDFESWIDAIDE